ncbi:hypothetical protein [Burkholderia cepacia]|uniref:hypothetical protein n=1 Tax=Burkholderia cepacia TaxID=292 RepID=UPI00158CB2D4|nr:hypothetical protein [Burkholderia cepacia]
MECHDKKLLDGSTRVRATMASSEFSAADCTVFAVWRARPAAEKRKILSNDMSFIHIEAL